MSLRTYLISVRNGGVPALGAVPTWATFVNAATGAALAQPAITNVAGTDACVVSYDPAIEAYGVMDFGGGFADPNDRYQDIYLAPPIPQFYVITARNGGIPQAGLTPVWVAGTLVTVPAGVALFPAPGFAAIGGGGYRVPLQATNNAYGQVDFGATLTDPNERYADVFLVSATDKSSDSLVAVLTAAGLSPVTPSVLSHSDTLARIAATNADASNHYKVP